MAKEKSYPHKIKKAAIIVSNRKKWAIYTHAFSLFVCYLFLYFFYFLLYSFWLVCLLPEKLVWFDVGVVFFFLCQFPHLRYIFIRLLDLHSLKAQRNFDFSVPFMYLSLSLVSFWPFLIYSSRCHGPFHFLSR